MGLSSVPDRPALDLETTLPGSAQAALRPRRREGREDQGAVRHQHPDLHRQVPSPQLRYTLVEDVVIYYVRLRDLNSREEWTFKTRYSELRNVHEALLDSKIKNL